MVRLNQAMAIGSMVILTVVGLLGTLPIRGAVIGHGGTTRLVLLNSLGLMLERKASSN